MIHRRRVDMARIGHRSVLGETLCLPQCLAQFGIPEKRHARMGHLIVQAAQILAVFEAHAPGDQKNRRMARARRADEARIIEKTFEPVAHPLAARDA